MQLDQIIIYFIKQTKVAFEAFSLKLNQILRLQHIIIINYIYVYIGI